MNTAALLLFPSPPPPPTKFPTLFHTPSPHPIHLPSTNFTISRSIDLAGRRYRRSDFRAWSDYDDSDGGDRDDFGLYEDEVEEVDNKKDFELDYDTAAALAAASAGGGDGRDEDIVMERSKSFVSTLGWDSEKIVDYRINEDEFHKICLLDCDFFIRKPPDPDNDVYDFREMYVTPPDTDIYSIPKVLAPIPEKYIRCAQSDYGCYNVTEPPIDAPRDPMYKSEKEVLKVFLTKHFRNRRLSDPDFTLDFEEIYVIDSKTKSISRAKVVVTVPEGRNRDRKSDLLVIRDNGDSFKIIPSNERDDPTIVIEKEDWNKTRDDMEKHLSKLRDFNVSNWF